tara:strand:- start:22 stop:942 length:921 start_codon:yes stop_codon:yes gene_type:complete
MVSSSTKRRAVKIAVEESLGCSAVACRALGLARSSYYRVSRISDESAMMRKEIIRLSEKHPRYGYRRITAMMRREGHVINEKRVLRVRREAGLKVHKRQRRARRVGLSTARRRQAVKRKDVWSWDFVTDQTSNGSHFRILTLVDEHTRECLVTHAGWSIRAVDVITIIEMAIERYGAPKHIRSDNGPEFIAYVVQDWLKELDIEILYIKPGSPWENAYIESFHDKLRDELLNREIFGTLREAQIILDSWRCEYNEERPHSSLGYQTPSEFAASCEIPHRPTASTPFRSASTNQPPNRNITPAGLHL